VLIQDPVNSSALTIDVTVIWWLETVFINLPPIKNRIL